MKSTSTAARSMSALRMSSYGDSGERSTGGNPSERTFLIEEAQP